MKKTIRRCMLLTIAAMTSFAMPSIAQDAAKELQQFTKKFQAAYNSKDDKTLKTFYSDDATRTAPDGTVANGSDAIVAQFKDYFTENKVTIDLKQTSVTQQADGSTTATGTYHVAGTSKTGEKIDRSGGYTNTLVKEKGQWKITKSIVTGS